MQDLTVIGVENGALLVSLDDGTRFRIAINETLHSKLREATPPPGNARKPAPREIQAQIRSGLSAEEVAAVTGVNLDYIRKFEGPVLAERALALGLIRDAGVAFPFGQGDTDLAFSADGEYARGFYQANRCYTPWLHSVIAADGAVYGCCQMKGEGRQIGSLQDHPFKAIWTGEAYRDYRLDLAQSRPAVCQRCDDFLPENRQLAGWLEES